MGEHYLICGDSTNPETFEKILNGKLCDLLVTDPPYNVNIVGKAGTILNDNMKNDDFQKFLQNAFSAIAKQMKPGGAFYIWHADTERYNFEKACKENGLTVRQNIIWVKNGATIGRQDYQWKHEPCLYGWKDGAAHYFIDDRTNKTVIEDERPDLNKLKKEEMKKLLEEIYSDKISTTVIHENKPLISELHPTMKPLKLLARLIKNSSKPGELVLEPFGGSGSTLIVCEQLGRKCYVVELDPKYCDVIIERWETFTGQKAELINEKGNEENV